MGNHTDLGENGRKMNGKTIEIGNKEEKNVRGIGFICKFAVHFPFAADKSGRTMKDKSGLL